MSMTFSVSLARPTETLLEEIEDPQTRQKDVALTYIMARASREVTDWPRVNRAIIDRWSRSGLLRVKRIAQKLLEQKGEPDVSGCGGNPCSPPCGFDDCGGHAPTPEKEPSDG